ncbi:hypothetical protein AV530_001454 [Patagioenas fasciata monilis]|uniref:Uncharacterized protein n=1 Tax=Patagioenas fasciata monilis TaxID=372326 RepID=A0A1V4J4Z9_PATFA|nr:hypothetical protein AV530_001454 [Patagioenas fasciata monilis]
MVIKGNLKFKPFEGCCVEGGLPQSSYTLQAIILLDISYQTEFQKYLSAYLFSHKDGYQLSDLVEANQSSYKSSTPAR